MSSKSQWRHYINSRFALKGKWDDINYVFGDPVSNLYYAQCQGHRRDAKPWALIVLPRPSAFKRYRDSREEQRWVVLGDHWFWKPGLVAGVQKSARNHVLKHNFKKIFSIERRDWDQCKGEYTNVYVLENAQGRRAGPGGLGWRPWQHWEQSGRPPITSALLTTTQPLPMNNGCQSYLFTCLQLHTTTETC